MHLFHKHTFSWWKYHSEGNRYKKQCCQHSCFYFCNSRHSITIAAWVASSTTRRTSCSFWFCESAILNTESIPWFLAIAREYALETFSQPLWNQVIKRKQMYKYPLTCTNPYFNILYFFFFNILGMILLFVVYFWSAFQGILFCILRFFATGKITNVKDWADIQKHLAILFQGVEAFLNDWSIPDSFITP